MTQSQSPLKEPQQAEPDDTALAPVIPFKKKSKLQTVLEKIGLDETEVVGRTFRATHGHIDRPDEALENLVTVVEVVLRRSQIRQDGSLDYWLFVRTSSDMRALVGLECENGVWRCVTAIEAKHIFSFVRV